MILLKKGRQEKQEGQGGLTTPAKVDAPMAHKTQNKYKIQNLK